MAYSFGEVVLVPFPFTDQSIEQPLVIRSLGFFSHYDLQRLKQTIALAIG